MIQSMTGYGRANAVLAGRDITVELRAVNHRYFDCTVKAGRLYGYLEEPAKKAAQSRVARGKLDIFITIDASQSEDVDVTLNPRVFEAYLGGLRAMCQTYGLRDDISASSIARYPEVFTVTQKQADAESLTADVLSVLESALDEFEDMRRREGEKLAEDIAGRARAIEAMLEEVARLSPLSVSVYREKLEARIRDLLGGANVDETRLLTEAALFADRIAVDEEQVRLRSHLQQMAQMLQSPAGVGRKLDFLVQECNREANTIGSKAADLEITRLVVDIKAEIEKIREQVQNIE